MGEEVSTFVSFGLSIIRVEGEPENAFTGTILCLLDDIRLSVTYVITLTPRRPPSPHYR